MNEHTIQLRLGDCIEVLRSLPDNSVGAFVTDPPYGLSFMNKDWDAPWKYAFTEPGFTDGGNRRPAPSFSSSRNPTCRGCGLRQRTWEGGPEKCECEEPQFDSVEQVVSERQMFQQWCESWLRECLRVLRPGGIIKVFGATRMFHRMCAAMEGAGFLLPPGGSLEAWAYGCLTDDAEILTKHGWKLGVDVVEGERVACWDPSAGDIQLDAVQEVFCKPYEGEMVVFRNDNTDQVLTPNHRVYKKHRIRKMVDGVRVTSEEAEWNVQPAGEINRWNNIRLPLAGIHDGPGIGGEDWARLLAWIWTEGGFDQQPHGVRIYQSSVNMEYVNEIQALLDRLVPGHKLYTRDRTYKDRRYTEFCWFFAGDLARKVRAELPEKRPTWDLLWGMTLAEKRAFVDAALKGDGSCSQGRWAFYQKHPDDLVWFQTLAHLMNQQGRINFRKRVVGLHMNPQTQLQGRHLRAAVSEFYEGDVWCVRVPTGAFVARRADKVFITGNSGCPKYKNTSKAIDQQAGRLFTSVIHIKKTLAELFDESGKSRKAIDTECGFRACNYLSYPEPGKRPDPWFTVLPSQEKWAVIKTVIGVEGQEIEEQLDKWFYEAEREVIGQKRAVPGVAFSSEGPDVLDITAPATPEAARFEGFATALKPGWEPFIVGVKQAA